MIAVGDTLDGKYRIAARLGSGGFGEVFVATDSTVPDRRVAIKVLSAGSAVNQDNLIWEMRALAKFNHPGVVTFFHHFSDGDRLFLAMEYCSGGSLDGRLLGGSPCSPADVFTWGLTLCQTLGFVHENGIIHHDIKPANILFRKDGAIKIGDFGVANRKTGTPLYFAPELLLGEQSEWNDQRVDVYALGITLLEALIGHHPFEGLPPDARLLASMAHDFVPDSLPRWQQDVFLKATHPAPELRFQNMKDFAEAIEGNRVVHAFDAKRVKAHELAEKAESLLKRKKWKSAEKLITKALTFSPDCVPALLTAGRCQLLVQRIDEAGRYFMRALSISPRTQAQKELGWINLEAGRIPLAISLFGDHLTRNPQDHEAYNLLLKCYYISNNYDAVVDLAEALIGQKAANNCFKNNLFIARLLLDHYNSSELESFDVNKGASPFLSFNLTVAREKPSSWSRAAAPPLKSKLLFQDYRFDRRNAALKANILAVHHAGRKIETALPIITFGTFPGNDIVFKSRQVSRRHCAIVNYPNYVWLYDLGSTGGTRFGDRRIEGPQFLDGLHELEIAGETVQIETNVHRLL